MHEGSGKTGREPKPEIQLTGKESLPSDRFYWAGGGKWNNSPIHLVIPFPMITLSLFMQMLSPQLDYEFLEGR